MSALISKPGITSASTLSIPKDWDRTWFRNLIQNQLQGADIRNAVGTNGIKVTGNIASPYATITIGSSPIVIGPAPGSGATTFKIQGTNAVGALGFQVNAGSSASNYCAGFADVTGTKGYLTLYGDGSGVLGYNPTTAGNIM